jgi:hypothetical protein
LAACSRQLWPAFSPSCLAVSPSAGEFEIRAKVHWDVDNELFGRHKESNERAGLFDKKPDAFY